MSPYVSQRYVIHIFALPMVNTACSNLKTAGLADEGDGEEEALRISEVLRYSVDRSLYKNHPNLALEAMEAIEGYPQTTHRHVTVNFNPQ